MVHITRRYEETVELRKYQLAILNTSLWCPIFTFLSPVLWFLSRHLQGRDGSPEDLFVASALTADPAGAGAALLRPESHVPTIPAATCGPFSDRWQ